MAAARADGGYTNEETMSEGNGGTRSAKERLREELRRYVVISAYLYICFGAIQLYKAALLNEAGIRYVPLGFALAKALILGKFLLIGESARVGTRLRSPTLLHRIANRAVLLFLLLIVLAVAEELLVGAFHGKSMAQVLAEYGGQRVAELAATSFLVLLVLIPLIVVEDVNEALRPGGLRGLLLAPPPGAPAGEPRSGRQE
jgi:hypothetical protein